MREVNVSQLKPLVDMDLLVYRCGFAADAEVKRSGYDPTEAEYLHNCLHMVNTTMEHKVLGKFSGQYRGFLSGNGNFREQIATIKPYKGNRPDTNKPKYYKEIKKHLVDRWGAEIVHGREADDALGTAQWAAKDLSTILVTIDKDLDSIPGHHFNWVKDEFYFVPLRDANLFHFYQLLNGDTTDNIPGIKGVGPKTIERIWKDCDYDLAKIREAVQGEYRRQYGPEWQRAYEEVSRLLWIERVEGKGCPFLWS